MEHDQTIADVVEEVWREVKEDMLTAQKIETLAEKGIKFGDVNLEEASKPRLDHADNVMMLKMELEKLAPISRNEPVTPALKHYLLNAAYQRNLRITITAVKKLFNLQE